MDLPVRLLGKWDQSADTAEALARDLAYGYEVKDCEPEQETAFKAWLAGETDRMPEKMPCGSFPERLCAYFASLCDKQRGITNIPYLEKYKFIAK